MLIALAGMHALGKTYFLDHIMDSWTLIQPDLTIVMADLATEYSYNPKYNAWDVTRIVERYKRTKAQKASHLDFMIQDHSRYWVVESARYFAGMDDIILSSYKAAGGGIRFVVVTCPPDVGKLFLQERCAKINKKFNETYWDLKRLDYECRGRYVNLLENHYNPAEVLSRVIPIDYERENWKLVNKLIQAWLKSPAEEWYNVHSPDQRHERQRQDNHRKTIDSIIRGR